MRTTTPRPPAARPSRLLERDCPDGALLDAVVEVVAVPRAAPADSFVLHAPLEVLARAALLPLVAPAGRPAARARLVEIADRYEATGPPVDPPVGPPLGRPVDLLPDRRDPAVAATALVAAIRAGELDEVDRAAAALARSAAPVGVVGLADLAPLVDLLVPSLAAAAHGPILLELLGRAGAGRRAPLALLRPIAREAARHPGWALTWPRHQPLRGTQVEALAPALLDVPRLGLPGSPFVHPIMRQVEERGVAAAVVAPALPPGSAPAAVGRVLAEVASLSMVADDPASMPYGWTHCLTIPQAIVAVAGAATDPDVALAVAATHVAGFRAALSDRAVPRRFAPEPTGLDPVEALDAGPSVAAASTVHAPRHRLVPLRTELATAAAAHPDAHLAKFTLAAFDAAERDPAAARLHLAAAAALAAWWRAAAQEPSAG